MVVQSLQNAAASSLLQAVSPAELSQLGVPFNEGQCFIARAALLGSLVIVVRLVVARR